MRMMFLCSALVLSAHAIAEADQTLVYHWDEPATQEDKTVAAHLESAGYLETINAAMDSTVPVTETLVVRFVSDDDPEPSPYYDPDSREVIMQYGFWNYVATTYAAANDADVSGDQINAVSDDVFIHTVYHELAHAMIDIMSLPITGREENAADEMGALMILDHFDSGDEIALNAAEFFEIEGYALDEITDDDMFGSHALDDQRFFNIVCLVYGHGSEIADALMSDLDIPDDRLSVCEEDYVNRRVAWDTLLQIN